jgi:hypothetical protein
MPCNDSLLPGLRPLPERAWIIALEAAEEVKPPLRRQTNPPASESPPRAME